MSELQLYYDNFKTTVSCGALCEGEKCSGWFLSDVDTWHHCPCNAGGTADPETTGEMTEADYETYMTEVRTKNASRLVGWFAVSALIDGRRLVISVNDVAKAAQAQAQDAVRYGGFQSVIVKRISTEVQAQEAVCQMAEAKASSGEDDDLEQSEGCDNCGSFGGCHC